FRAPALDANRKRSVSVGGHSMSEGVCACAIGAALSRRGRAFRYVPDSRHVRAKAGLAIIGCGSRHQQREIVQTAKWDRGPGMVFNRESDSRFLTGQSVFYA